MLPDSDFSNQDPTQRATFLERLGVRLDDGGRLVLDVAAGHLRSLGIAHGGVIATLLDSVMGMVSARSAPPDHYLVTAQINVHFLRPAREGETLLASAEVRHAGRKTAVAHGEVRTSADHLIATASATFVYVPHTDPTRGRAEPTGPPPATPPVP